MIARRSVLAVAMAATVGAAAPGLAAGVGVPTTLPGLPLGAPPVSAAPPAPVGDGAAGLAPGARGPVVADLQRALRARGMQVTADGTYGPGTRRAVARLQRRLGLRASGRADARLLRRLGLRVRGARSGGSPAADAAPAPAVPARVAPGTRSGRWVKAFPVAGPNDYVPSFGAPRGQGPHEGADLMARRGVPVVAVADGWVDRLTRVETGLGGLWVWLRARDGTEFYYAHLDTVAAALRPGLAVRAGDVLGTVGNTGDARWGAPHLHFEIHPGGGSAVDPYPDLVRADPDPPRRG
ncbi:MAG: peptidoglycan DD-metalloendopeptidase family protein [Thermoleophilia bacterium]|nr:peptidoglycan DD-metalloendopeptidase family protein [Thermoleophilia bacterium]